MAFLMNQKAKCPECKTTYEVFRVRQDEPIIEPCGPCAVEKMAELFFRQPEQIEFEFAFSHKKVLRFGLGSLLKA